MDASGLYLLPRKTGTYFYRYAAGCREMDLKSKFLMTFGEEEFFTGMPRRFGLRIVRQEVMYELPRFAFIEMISRNTVKW